MSGFAFAQVQGRLTRDPELNNTNNGKQVVNFSLAVNRRFSKEETADFFDVTAWGKTAENVAAHKKKGDLVMVQGDLQNDTWEKDGQKRVKTKLVAQNVVFVSSKGENNGSSPASPSNDSNDDIPF